MPEAVRQHIDHAAIHQINGNVSGSLITRWKIRPGLSVSRLKRDVDNEAPNETKIEKKNGLAESRFRGTPIVKGTVNLVF
ncbi:hypothetical protein AVEN_143402-1 [Araneus ventricosus]|uniref:Uncharacterized protein n=1 Tax=Araneus ventricosus TaxID=182803 RepID=A0A4Y2AE45_ARAVE|nr:hypothetical protein AVEN_143402-1 [Araneus ventricosus]